MELRLQLVTIVALGITFGCSDKSSQQPSDESSQPSSKSEAEPAPAKAKGDPKATLIIAGLGDYGSMTAHAGRLIFAVDASVDGPRHLLALGAGAPELVATKIDGRIHFASDDRDIWWLSIAEDRAALYTVSPTDQGWSPPKLVSDALPPDESRGWDLALTQDYAYIPAAEHGLLRIARAGGELETVAKRAGAYVGTVAAAGSSVYWIEIDKDFNMRVYGAEDATIAKPTIVAESEFGLRGLGATADAVFWSGLPSKEAQYELMRRKRGGEPERLATYPEDIVEIVPGDGFVALELWDHVGIWREGSDSIVKLDKKGMYAPQVTVIGDSVIWLSNGGVQTTPGASFLAARDYLPLPAKELVAAGP